MLCASGVVGCVDLLEPVAALLEESRRYLMEEEARGLIGTRHALPMQAFASSLSSSSSSCPRYALVWVQWVLIYLVDDVSFVAFMRALERVLAVGGVVVVKENHTRQERGFVVDASDASITRSRRHLDALFAVAGFTTLTRLHVPLWPQQLFPVTLWALMRSEDKRRYDHDRLHQQEQQQHQR